MKTSQELYNERLTRFKKAMNLEKPDRLPIYNYGSPCFPGFVDPNFKKEEYFSDAAHVDDLMFKAFEMFPEIDNAPMMAYVSSILGVIWYAKMKLPGRELAPDAMWQVDEVGPMKEEDYDTIINKGWKGMSAELLFNRLGYTPEGIALAPEYLNGFHKKVENAGLVEMFPYTFVPPFEILSGARSLAVFMKDLRRMPEKVIAAINVMADEMAPDLKASVEAINPLTVFNGATRGGCDFLSLKMFEKFFWPTTKKLSDVVIEGGSKVLFHFDGNWEANLPYFLEFPKTSGIFDSDSLTNIFKVKEILGDHMCITGDVPPALLSVGTPEEVYNYSRKLVAEIGPKGFIMSIGCMTPPNAKLENIKAMNAVCL